MRKIYIILLIIAIVLPVNSISYAVMPLSLSDSGGSAVDDLHKTIDNDTDTFWYIQDNNAFIVYEYEQVQRVSSIGIIWHRPENEYRFSIQVSEEEDEYETIVENAHCFNTADMQIYSFPTVGTKHIMLKASTSKGLGIKEFILNPPLQNADEKADAFSEESKIHTNGQDIKSDNDAPIETALLMALGIIKASKDDFFNAEAKLTRAQAVALIIRCLGLGDYTDYEQQFFKDVPPEHNEFSEVNTAYRLGLVSGVGDDRFAPDEAATIQQVAKLVVKMLEHDVKAEAMDNTLTSYSAIATELKLFSGVSFLSSEYITGAEMAKVLYNALHTAVFERQAYGLKESYQLGPLFMEKYFDLFRGTGIIASNDFVSLFDTNRPQSGYVRIKDDKNDALSEGIYKEGEANASDFFGRKVVFYYFNKTHEEPVLLLVKPVEASTSVAKITPENFLSITYEKTGSQGEVGYGNVQISYVDGGKELSCAVLDNAKIIANNKKLENFNFDRLDDFGNLNAELTLIDNGGGFDIVILKQYNDFVVDTISTSSIYGMYHPNTLINLEGKMRKRDYTIFFDGEETDIQKLQKWDVLSVAESDDESYIEITVCREQKQGKVVEVIGDDFLNIDGIVYFISKDATDTLGIQPGDEAIFHFNKFGYVSAVSHRTNSMQIAALIDFSASKNLMPSKIGLLTMSGYKVFELAPKVTYTNKHGDKLEKDGLGLVGENLLWDEANEDSCRKLISYTLNKENKVNSISQAIQGKLVTDGNDIVPNGTNLVEISDSRTSKTNSVVSGSLRYRKAGNLFGGLSVGVHEFFINEKTRIFTVPSVDSNQKLDYEEMALFNESVLIDNKDYIVSAYAVDDSAYAQYLLIRTFPFATPALNDKTWPLVITEIRDTIDSEGNVKKKLVGIRSGVEAEFLVKNDMVLSNYVVMGNLIGNYTYGYTLVPEIVVANTPVNVINKTKILPGDIVQCTFDEYTNEITGLSVIFDGSRAKTSAEYQIKGLNNTTQGSDASQLGTNYANQRIFGKVIAKKGDIAFIQGKQTIRDSNDAPMLIVPFDVGKAKVCSVDVKTVCQDGKVTSSSVTRQAVIAPNDILVGDEVFIRQSAAYCRDVVVFRWTTKD
ncbi:MAG: S-layer homology domain-containing protein [Firmicutes bacterium]|nr:S-layer homology domain-containing protein [Bacillota bacterium]